MDIFCNHTFETKIRRGWRVFFFLAPIFVQSKCGKHFICIGTLKTSLLHKNACHTGD